MYRVSTPVMNDRWKMLPIFDRDRSVSSVTLSILLMQAGSPFFFLAKNFQVFFGLPLRPARHFRGDRCIRAFFR